MSKDLKSYASQLKIFASSRVASDTFVLYVSSMVASGVGFLSSVLVARQLGPVDFALISGFNAVVITLAGFTDFGLGTGLIRFASLHKNGKKSAAYYKAVFIAELIIGALLLFFGMLFSTKLGGLAGTGLPINVIQIAVLAGAITSVTAYVGAALAAHKKFKINAVISISISTAKLLYILALLYTGNVSVTKILIGYLGLSMLNAILGFTLAPKDYTADVPTDELIKASKDIMRFSGWLTLTFFITSITGKLDFFYLYRIKGPAAAGVYAAAQQLAIIYSMLVGAISTVATPYISEKVAYRDKITFLKKSLPIAMAISLVFIASTVVVPFAVMLIFGDKYTDAIIPLQILIVHLAINVFMIPISLLFIPMGKVKVGTFITALQLGIALIGYPRLISMYGAPGAATTVLLTTIFGLVAYSFVLGVFLTKEKARL